MGAGERLVRRAGGIDARPVQRAQESYDLGALDWERVDASGTPDQTLARAHAALERLTRSARASTA